MPPLPLSTIWGVYEPALEQLRVHAKLDPTRVGRFGDAARDAVVGALEARGPEIDRSIPGVGIVSLRGVLMKDGGFFSASTREAKRQIEMLAADEQVETIVIHVDSPGGSIDGTHELSEAVRVAAGQKRVVAQADGMIASAAYWAVAHATEIVAGPLDLIGSIGTTLLAIDWSRYFEDAGLRAVHIKTGEYKAAGAMGTEITEEQERDFQRIMDGLFEGFRGAVTTGRGMSDKQWAAVSDGRVWLAEKEALGLGLVDRVSSLDDTLRALATESASRNAVRTASRRLAALRGDDPGRPPAA